MFQVIVLFAPVLIAVTLAVVIERLAPARDHNTDPLRKIHSFVLYLTGVVGTLLVVPGGQFAAVQFTQAGTLGVLNWVELPFWLSLVIGIVALDLAEWIGHYALHRIPALWRLHSIHHSDGTVDIATGYRFHPIETILRYSLGVVMIFLVGVPVESIFAFTLLAIGFNAWEHANAYVPKPLRALHVLFITPELHRVHHSVEPGHLNSNFGVLFSVWDQLFGTKTLVSDSSTLTFGIQNGIEQDNETITDLFIGPFRKQR